MATIRTERIECSNCGAAFHGSTPCPDDALLAQIAALARQMPRHQGPILAAVQEVRDRMNGKEF